MYFKKGKVKHSYTGITSILFAHNPKKKLIITNKIFPNKLSTNITIPLHIKYIELQNYKQIISHEKNKK